MSVHRKHISKYNIQDATLHNLYISVKCSKCFIPFLRPLSGAQNCIYSIGYLVKLLLLPATTIAGSCKGLIKYPMLYIQFWAPDDGRRNRLKHVEHFAEINKLLNVASCWLYLEIHENIRSVVVKCCNPLKTKRRPLYLKTQSVPRSKHFSSRL